MENNEVIKALEGKLKEFKEKYTFDAEKLENLESAIGEVKGKLENEKTGEQIEKLSKAFEGIAEDVQKLSEMGKKKENPNHSFFKSLEVTVKDLKENAHSIKTVGTMTFGTSVTGTIPQADRDPVLNDTNKRQFRIRDLAAVGSTTANVVEWVYKTGKEGGAGMTGEGLAKTQQDFEYLPDSANVRKITSYIKISKEMLDDIAGIMSDINNELSYEIDYLEETQLIEGDGTGQNLNGIEKYAQPLDNAGLAGSITNPNYYDVLAAAITQIATETEGRSIANAILLNPIDRFKLVHATRTTTDEYNAPLAVADADGTRIWGVPVIESNSVTAGEFIVADMRKFKIKDREQTTVAMGYENDDWTKNLVTILAEKRLVSYVAKNDEAAFVTDTFADGVTFLTAAS